MLSNDSCLHLVFTENAASCVRQGLRLVGREDDVEYFYDDLSVGPIRDVNRGAASRPTWWRRVHANNVRPRPKSFDEAPLWKRILADDRMVVLWNSSHPAEYLLALRACWYLRRTLSKGVDLREDETSPTRFAAPSRPALNDWPAIPRRSGRALRG